MIVPGESLITGPCPLRLQLESTIPPEYVRIGAGVGDFVTEAGGVGGAASNAAKERQPKILDFVNP